MKRMLILILRAIFKAFYDGKFLHGFYFDEKKIGWYWAYKGLHNRVFDINARKVPWPINPRTIVSGAKNIHFELNSINVFQTPGCYWQAHDAQIYIGSECYVGPNVGVITTNHSTKNPSHTEQGKPVSIGDYCWVGMNAIILPGVSLGSHTTVGAGSVVTKSFPDGNCIIAGNPAKVIKILEIEKSNDENT